MLRMNFKSFTAGINLKKISFLKCKIFHVRFEIKYKIIQVVFRCFDSFQASSFLIQLEDNSYFLEIKA